MNNEMPAEFPGFADELRAYWRGLPNKTVFFPLLAAWLALFHFLGNATFGYTNTPSLLRWMYNAYIAVILLLMLLPKTVTARPRFLFTAFDRLMRSSKSTSLSE